MKKGKNKQNWEIALKNNNKFDVAGSQEVIKSSFLYKQYGISE